MSPEQLIIPFIWVVAGLACLARLFVKKPFRDVGFAILPHEAGISLLVFMLIFYTLASGGLALLKFFGIGETNAFIIANFVSQLALIGVFLFAPSRIESKPSLFSAKGKNGIALLLKGAVYSLLFFGVFSAVNFAWLYIMKFFDASISQQEAVDIFVNTKAPIYRAMLLVSLLVFAPVWEELFFRGGLYGSMKSKFGALLAAFFSAFFFAAVHFSITVFVPIFLLGLFLALLYEKYGDIRISIGAHAAFNLTNVLVLICAPELSNI